MLPSAAWRWMETLPPINVGETDSENAFHHFRFRHWPMRYVSLPRIPAEFLVCQFSGRLQSHWA